MLAGPYRLRSSRDFSATTRSGVRAGEPTVVVHARSTLGARATQSPDIPPATTQVGFVVSKAVGNAVTRNRVKRRLRHLSRDLLATTPSDLQLVVRALPDAASQPERLGPDLAKAWTRALAKVERKSLPARAHEPVSTS